MFDYHYFIRTLRTQKNYLHGADDKRFRKYANPFSYTKYPVRNH